MNIRKYLQNFLPNLATTLSLLILPVVAVIYYVVTQYSDRFITEQNINYSDVQNNFLGQLFLDQKWVEWFNRFMDFAIWGILAIVVLVAFWAFGSAKISFKNHYAVEGFKNFNESKSSWHTHFFIVLAIKVALIVAIIFSVLSVVGKLIPQLSTDISILLQGYSFSTLKSPLLTCLYIVMFEYLIIASIKIYRNVRSA